MTTETIYALYDTRDYEYFYCGRTKRALPVRMAEHRRNYKTGTELKYQHMRFLESQGIEWRVDILDEVGPGTDHFEDYYTYKLLCEGHPLKNQKMGDSVAAANWNAMHSMRDRKERFTSPQEFLSAREREVAESKARAANAKLHAKVKNDCGPWKVDSGESLFVADDPKTRFMSPWMKDRLARKSVVVKKPT